MAFGGAALALIGLLSWFKRDVVGLSGGAAPELGRALCRLSIPGRREDVILEEVTNMTARHTEVHGDHLASGCELEEAHDLTRHHITHRLGQHVDAGLWLLRLERGQRSQGAVFHLICCTPTKQEDTKERR
jgi:hypothetical protein